MNVGIEEIEINEDKTVEEFMDEIHLSQALVMLVINGEVFCPDEVKDRSLRRGDKVTLIPVIAGG